MIERQMTTMNTVHDNDLEMPRFADGMLDLRELSRTLIETLVNEIMGAQADMLCEDGNIRNGYRERKLMTSVGEITMKIPKLRIGTYFPEDMINRYSRTDRAVIAAVSEMYTNGISTRKVEKVATKMGIDHMSASQVSRMCTALDQEVADLQSHIFEDINFPYLWLDATYLKCRNDGHVESMAVVTAIACGSDGYRRFVGFDVVDTESYGSWTAFLSNLRARGVEGVRCVTSDAHAGLKRAIEEIYTGVTWQRCIVHLERNVCVLLNTRRHKAMAGKAMQAVFRQKDPIIVREAYHVAIDEIAKLSKKAAELLEEAEADALAYLDFPQAHHRRLRTNNVQERANREIKRRSHVVQIFPSTKSLIRLIGAVCSEIDEDWSSRHYISPTSLAELEETAPITVVTVTEEIKEMASRLIAVAIESVGSERRAA
jgi:putative transposase